MTVVEASPRPLVVQDLRVRYGGVVAVDGVSFSVEPGRCLGIIGANGAGAQSKPEAKKPAAAKADTKPDAVAQAAGPSAAATVD